MWYSAEKIFSENIVKVLFRKNCSVLLVKTIFLMANKTKQDKAKQNSVESIVNYFL